MSALSMDAAVAAPLMNHELITAEHQKQKVNNNEAAELNAEMR